MNKSETIAKMSELSKGTLSKKTCGESLELLMTTIKEALKEGDKVQLIGFGTFETRERAARVGRNPATNEKINIPESTVPVFKAGKELKDILK